MTEMKLEQVFPVDVVNNGTVAVDGRMLLKWLGKRDSDFSRNIKSAIDRAGLVENVDYQVIKSAQQGGGAEIKDYVFHPDSTTG